MREFMGTKEVCARFDVTVMTLHRWMQKMGFPQPYKLGTARNSFKISEVEQWERAQVSKPRVAPKKFGIHAPGRPKETRNELTQDQVDSLVTPGKYFDGGGLYVAVRGEHQKYWGFKFRFKGKEYSMGLGSAELVSLTEARNARLAAKKLLLKGINPADHKREEKRNAILDEPPEPITNAVQSTGLDSVDDIAREIVGYAAICSQSQQWKALEKFIVIRLKKIKNASTAVATGPAYIDWMQPK